jgi:hypothetical protein
MSLVPVTSSQDQFCSQFDPTIQSDVETNEDNLDSRWILPEAAPTDYKVYARGSELGDCGVFGAGSVLELARLAGLEVIEHATRHVESGGFVFLRVSEEKACTALEVVKNGTKIRQELRGGKLVRTLCKVLVPLREERSQPEEGEVQSDGLSSKETFILVEIVGHSVQCMQCGSANKCGCKGNCYRCGAAGHEAAECKEKRKCDGCQQEKTFCVHIKCFKCGDLGHFAQECTQDIEAGSSVVVVLGIPQGVLQVLARTTRMQLQDQLDTAKEGPRTERGVRVWTAKGEGTMVLYCQSRRSALTAKARLEKELPRVDQRGYFMHLQVVKGRTPTRTNERSHNNTRQFGPSKHTSMHPWQAQQQSQPQQQEARTTSSNEPVKSSQSYAQRLAQSSVPLAQSTEYSKLVSLMTGVKETVDKLSTRVEQLEQGNFGLPASQQSPFEVLQKENTSLKKQIADLQQAMKQVQQQQQQPTRTLQGQQKQQVPSQLVQVMGAYKTKAGYWGYIQQRACIDTPLSHRKNKLNICKTRSVTIIASIKKVTTGPDTATSATLASTLAAITVSTAATTSQTTADTALAIAIPLAPIHAPVWVVKVTWATSEHCKSNMPPPSFG